MDIDAPWKERPGLLRAMMLCPCAVVFASAATEDTFPSSLQPAFGAFSSFSFGEFSFVLTLYPKFTLSGIFAQVTSHSTFEQSGVAGAIAWYAEPSEARLGVHWSVCQQDEGW